MAPISEKRQQSIIVKENAKENHQGKIRMQQQSQQQQQSNQSNQNNRKPEILDFREYWLQEIEMYKDHVKAQQLLTAHNHLHTPDGCNPVEQTTKRRARTKSDSDEQKLHLNSYDDGLVLKRPREDNHNSSAHNNNNNNNLKITSASTAPTTANAAATTAIQIMNQMSLKHGQQSQHPQQQAKTYIVNPYHALLIRSTELGLKTKFETDPENKNSIRNNSHTTSHQEQQQNSKTMHGDNKTQPKSSSSYKKTHNQSHSQQRGVHQQQKDPNSQATQKQTQNETNTQNSPNNRNTSKKNRKNINNNNEEKLIGITDLSSNFTNANIDSNASKDHHIKINDLDNNILDKLIIKTVDNDNDAGDHREKKIVDDSDSDYGDDEVDFGAIDAELEESSDDSDDEYRGCLYCVNSEEENDEDIHNNYDREALYLIKNSISTYENTVRSNLIENDCKYSNPTTPFASSLFPNVPPFWIFSSHMERGPIPIIDLQKVLKWRWSPVMPKVVRRVVANSGFRLIKKTNDWIASWEKHMKSTCFKSIRSHQKFNHLPGTFKIGRKDSVWRNIRSFISKHGKKEFGFMKKTYVLPQDLELLKKAWPREVKKGTKWIIKPPASARGAGIRVVCRWSEFPKQKPLIVQKYIERPLLINGNKFDLRLYVVITSINPLRIFLHTDGLARFASVQYSNNVETLNDRCMHLTNYSINKFSQNYTKNEDVNACQGHKWTLKSLWSYFRERGINTKRLWGTLRDLVIKTIIGGESCLNRMYKGNVGSRYNCYELFGFDVLLDENLTPWLLEVNISPSLHSDLPLDLHVKGPLVQAVLNSAMYQVPPKFTEQQQESIKRIYHLNGPLCYDRRIYTTKLTQEEIKKHNFYTGRTIDLREEYLDSILEELTPDDVRCLIIAEDELARSSPLERIFPTAYSYRFLKFLEGSRYYNRLIDAWENRYSKNRSEGIKVLQKLCENGIHLQTSVLEKEPSVDIDVFELNQYIKNSIKSIDDQANPNTQQSVQSSTCVKQAICRDNQNNEDFRTTAEVK